MREHAGGQKEWVLDSDGSLVQYTDAYKDVTVDDVSDLQGFEQYIIAEQNNIKSSFLRIGAVLIEIEARQLYKAGGVPTMKAWMESAEFDFSYEHGTRLMRIVRDLVPILGAENLPPLSTLKEVLPMLSEGKTPDEIRDAVEQVRDLSTRDAIKELREMRGIEQKTPPIIFRARVHERVTYNEVYVTRTGGEDGDFYELTPREPLYIKKKDWARWAERFGDAFIEYE